MSGDVFGEEEVKFGVMRVGRFHSPFRISWRRFRRF